VFATTVISLTPDSSRPRMLICKQFSTNRRGKGEKGMKFSKKG